MAETASLKITLYEKCMAQANPPKEVSKVKKMSGQSLLLSSNKMTHCFE